MMKIKIYDLRFFDELAKRGISPFTGDSAEAKRRAKQRLIKRGILPDQLAERGGQYSYWEVFDAKEIIDRAALSFDLRRQGFGWKAIVGNFIVLPIIEQVRELPQPPVELTKLSLSEIQVMDWSKVVESVNWVLGMYDTSHDSLSSLSKSEKFEVFFYIQAILQWFLRDKLSSSAILANLKKEIRQASAKRSGYVVLEAWICESFGNDVMEDLGDIFLLSAIGERNLNAENVISILENSMRNKGIPTNDIMTKLYGKLVDGARVSVERNEFNVEQLSKKFGEILDAQNV